MQTNNPKPNRGRNYTPVKTSTEPEPEMKPTYLSSLFKTTDPDEAEAERAKLFGYVPRNTNKSGSFTI